jgi:hypothetical protein
MATTKVSDLSALTTTDGAEELLINDGGTSKKVTVANLLHDNSIDSDHYVDGSIDNAHLADDAVDSDELAAGAVDIAHLSATGTAGSSNFLRGDNSWVTPTDTNTTYSAGSSSALGLIKLEDDDVQTTAASAITTTSSRTYGLQVNSSGQGVINVPWADTNTTYSVTDGELSEINFTSADHTKLNAIEASATADQTAGEILTLLEDGIDSVHYKDGSIDNEHLADNAVGLAEMAGGTDGNIISYDASGDPVAIATGNDGQVLTSAGAGQPPAFEDAGGGDLVDDTSPQLGGFLDANGHYMQTEKGTTISSASPTVIPTDGDYFILENTVSFSAFTVAADRQFTLWFNQVLTMTHHATNLALPGGEDITTANGDVAVFQSTAANQVQCISYSKATGRSIKGAIEKVTRAYTSSTRAAFSDGRDLFANNVGFVGWNQQFSFTKNKADTDLLVVFAMSVCNFNDCYVTAIYTGTNGAASNLHRFAFAGKNAIGDTDPLDGMIVTGQVVLTGIAAGVNNWQWAMGRDNDGYNSQYTLNPDTNDGAQYLGATHSTIMVYEGDFTT